MTIKRSLNYEVVIFSQPMSYCDNSNNNDNNGIIMYQLRLNLFKY